MVISGGRDPQHFQFAPEDPKSTVIQTQGAKDVRLAGESHVYPFARGGVRIRYEDVAL